MPFWPDAISRAAHNSYAGLHWPTGPTACAQPAHSSFDVFDVVGQHSLSARHGNSPSTVRSGRRGGRQYLRCHKRSTRQQSRSNTRSSGCSRCDRREQVTLLHLAQVEDDVGKAQITCGKKNKKNDPTQKKQKVKRESADGLLFSLLFLFIFSVLSLSLFPA